MPKGVYDRNKDTSMETAVSRPSKMFPVLLTKNYAPRGDYEIVGYLRPEVRRKDSAGNWRVESKEEFVRGEMKPHESPGVGYAKKIWAGTHIKLPVEEAKAILALKIAERADEIAA